jgi:hypothetical protein
VCSGAGSSVTTCPSAEESGAPQGRMPRSDLVAARACVTPMHILR